MRLFSILICFILSIIQSFSQTGHNEVWKRYRTEVNFGVGAALFFGDLGGGNGLGMNQPSLNDLDTEGMRPAFHMGFRYRFMKNFSGKFNIYSAWISADDQHSESEDRKNRNLHFKSHILEFSTQLELHLLAERRTRRSEFYQPRRKQFNLRSRMNLYLFAGVGFCHFNPQAKDKHGNWYELQPLGTEGQGIKGSSAKYDLYAWSFPVGVGYRFFISSNWSLGFEVGARYTSSDYIDDTSGNYFDNEVLREFNGDKAAELADRHLPVGSTKFAEGAIRGNPGSNDAYIFAMFTVAYSYHKLKMNIFR